MKRIFTIGFLLFIITCKQPYIPPPILAHHHYLVVEGFINAGIGSTVITLTRTRDLTDTGYLTISGVTDSIFVLGATVTVEDKLGNSFVLPEMGKGQYGGIQLNLNPQGQYRLLIKTKDGSEYASSWSPVLPPPLIDSVYWRLEGDGVHIYTDVSG
ncbi:MAG: DUF4249 family protein, partial [Chitinophagaceae bacterium]